MKNIKFTKSHEWVEFLEDDVVRIGLTDYAQEAMGDLVFINLPEIGDEVSIGDAFADVESVKAVEDVLSPVSGEITAINEELLDSPELINAVPYDSWLIEVSNITEKGELIEEDEYKQFSSEEA